MLEAKGRHDPCVVPRAVPIVEAMAALVVMDCLLGQQGRWSARGMLPKLEGGKVAASMGVGVDAMRKEEKEGVNGAGVGEEK